MIAVGCVSALALGLAAASEYRTPRCKPQDPDDPNSIPENCGTSSPGGGSYAGHGYYGFSGSSGFGSSSATSRASFGGFGSSGADHTGAS
jgi:hypothetical protein